MKETKNTTPCDPCEQNFERNIRDVVKEGTAPSAREHRDKEHEVNEAFAEQGKPASR